MPTTNSGRRRVRGAVGLTGAALAGALVAASPALAGSATTSLPNGADLTVTVDSPVTGDTFVVPAGQSTVDVPLSGTASVAAGAPSVSWVYVVDVSTSTTLGCTASADILGCEKSAVTGLNNLVVTDGSALDVGLAIFAGDSETADISSAAGDQLVTGPADPDVTTAIGSITQLNIGQFTAKSTADGTNFSSGLQAADTILQAGSGTTKNVVFLSDGASNLGGGGFAAALAAVAGQATIYPFAVGAGASCAAEAPAPWPPWRLPAAPPASRWPTRPTSRTSSRTSSPPAWTRSPSTSTARPCRRRPPRHCRRPALRPSPGAPPGTTSPRARTRSAPRPPEPAPRATRRPRRPRTAARPSRSSASRWRHRRRPTSWARTTRTP